MDTIVTSDDTDACRCLHLLGSEGITFLGKGRDLQESPTQTLIGERDTIPKKRVNLECAAEIEAGTRS